MSLLRAFGITIWCLLLFIGNGGAAYVLIKDFPGMREFASASDALLVVVTCTLVACAVLALIGIGYVKALWLLLLFAGVKFAVVMASPFLFPEFSFLAALFVLAELALTFLAIRMNRVDNPEPEPFSPAEEF